MKKLTKPCLILLLLASSFFAGNQAFACAGVGMKECAPKMTPIIDKSGQKLTTKEEKAVRKAGDHFLRLELSDLMREGAYEGPEHFAFVANKYLAVSPKEWAKRLDALPRADWLVCPKALFKSLRVKSDGLYQVAYELLSVSETSKTGRNRHLNVKLKDQHKTLQVQYEMKNVDGRWKVQGFKIDPNFGFVLAPAVTEMYHRDYVRAKAFRLTDEEKLASKRLYDELTASVAKHCK
jgi:hypothetical protein